MNTIEHQGTPPAVVCIHGYCQSSAYWAPTVQRLGAAGRHAIAVDLPGFADSAALPGPYTMEGFADTVATLLDERGLDRVVMVGGSMGGVVAQHFALRHPHRLERLLLVATGAYTADPATALARAAQMAASPWNEAVVTPIVAGFFFSAPPPECLEAFRRQACAASPQAAVDAARSNARSRTLEQLSEITVPTLIIQGRHDKARTAAHGEEMRARISGARLEVLEGSGHTPQLEEPEAFHRLALPFLLFEDQGK